jgi:hypothetical protein
MTEYLTHSRKKPARYSFFNYLLKLRDDIKKNSPDAERFTLFRKSFNEIFLKLTQTPSGNSTCDTLLEEILQLFVKLWDSVSADEKYPLYVPPIYKENPMISKILKNFIIQLTQRLDGRKYNSGNFILGGIEGTGKTTISRALCIATSILCEDFLLIYYDYKRSAVVFPTIEELLLELDYRMYYNNYLGDFGQLTIEKEQKDEIKSVEYYVQDLQEGVSLKGLGIILDEIQMVTDVKQCPLEKAKVILNAAERFARYEGGFLILTGSSAYMSTMFFGNRTQGTRFENLPDINRTVCVYYHVPALRNTSQLANYLKQRYKLEYESQEQLSLILYHTGGIGRIIHGFISRKSKNTFFRLPSTINENSLQYYDDMDSYFAFILALIYIRQPETINHLLQWNSSQQTASGSDSTATISLAPFTQCFGIPIQTLRDYFREIGIKCSSAQLDNILNRLVEAGLLYRNVLENEDEDIEIAFPSLCATVYSARDPHDLSCLLCTILMVYHDVRNNAGYPMENYVRSNYRLNRLVENTFCSSFPIIHISIDPSTHVLHGSSSDKPKLTIEDLTNRLVIWDQETGIDGFEVQPIPVSWQQEDQTTGNLSKKSSLSSPKPPAADYKLVFWQNTGGKSGNTIGAGGLETYERHYTSSGTVANIKDDMLAGILVTAQVGMMTILHALKCSFPELHFQLDTIVITTTKDSPLGEKFLEGNSCFQISKQMIRKFLATKVKLDLKENSNQGEKKTKTEQKDSKQTGPKKTTATLTEDHVATASEEDVSGENGVEK